MNSKDAILATYGFGDQILDRYLSDLTDADLLVRAVEGQNHIAWQIGHLIVSERGMVEGIKPGASPELPPGFADVYARDEAATTNDDPSRFTTKAEYLRLMKAQREATKAALLSLTDEELDAPSQERFRQRIPTVGGVLLLAGNHVLMHIGQFVSVRRKLNKPVVI